MFLWFTDFGFTNSGFIVPAIIIIVYSLILLIIAGFLWNRRSRWISCVLGTSAVLSALSIILIRSNSLHRGFIKTDSLIGIMFLNECLFVIAIPIAILGMAMQIKRMDLQHYIPVSHETIEKNTNEIQEKGMLKVNCPKCGETLKVSEKHLHNMEKCKSCNAEFVPYEHIWY